MTSAQTLQPHVLSAKLEARYRDYLDTHFHFRDPALRESFRAALANGGLRKGPYVESTPVFERGSTYREVATDVLGAEPEEAFVSALLGDRALYQHQEAALRRVAVGRNTVVATGTGSGKTEAFLYPILTHLYQECAMGQRSPGVRALVLYPMNALVHDQRERLGEIAGRLHRSGSSFRFTYGQYVGETPEHDRDTFRHAAAVLQARSNAGHTVFEDGRVLHGEMVLRQEIRAHPPDILLTNYSMLEYLLLRPHDSPLFDGERATTWSFFVLDEAHQYRGTKGMEMALLLRRLKQRLQHSGRTRPIRCIATSATLLDEGGGTSSGSTFAQALFGEPFDDDDILTGNRVPPAPTSRLEYDRLRDILARGPIALKAVAAELFPSDQMGSREQAVIELVEAMSREVDLDGNPLLRARYHLFMRSLEGAFLRYHPTPHVVLDRGATEKATFEMGLCRYCGQHYLVGVIRAGRLVEPNRDPGHPDFNAEFFRPLEVSDEPSDGTTLWWLCTQCGRVATSMEDIACGHDATRQIEQVPGSSQHSDQALACTACGSKTDDPVREIVYGTDGPHAVLASTLFNELPAIRSKLLAFADGRQEAAFFAWFINETYGALMRRYLLNSALRRLHHIDPHEWPAIDDLALELRRELRRAGLAEEHISGQRLLHTALVTVWSEFVTDQPRTSLEGVGLAAWRWLAPKAFCVPSLFTAPPWNLRQDEASALVELLIASLRRDGAAELVSEDVDLAWSDLSVLAQQSVVQLGAPGGSKRIKSWDGPMGRRATFLAQLLRRQGAPEDGIAEEVSSALLNVWAAIAAHDDTVTPDARILTYVEGGRRLNPRWWRLQPQTDFEDVYRCATCHRIQHVNVAGVCSRYRCGGRLEALAPESVEHDHYRRIYEHGLRGPFRAEEHTAQLASSIARDYQQAFKRGAIDLLSCSTTFEVGVDLGDLDVVFLRNVPPESFNYAQRVGRAGRRDAPGFAITYCRRTSHDLYHYADPMRMLAGVTDAPRLSVRNPRIAMRHVSAVVLAAYFRGNPERFGTVEALVGSWETPSIVDDVRAFVAARAETLAEQLGSLLPEPLHDDVGISDGSWISTLAGEGSVFERAVVELVADVRELGRIEAEAAAQQQYNEARWAQLRSGTLQRDNVLAFLSRKSVIPKYGFPVDVVELQTLHQNGMSDVTLQRDLAIAVAEFAPSSSLVANKRLWTSYGLKRVPGKEWPRWHYLRCQEHNTFRRSLHAEDLAAHICCDRSKRGVYIDPIFGFVTDRKPPTSPRRKPRRRFTTRPHFAGFVDAHEGEVIDLGVARVRPATAGQLVVLCEGSRQQRFFICSACGAGFDQRPKGQHKTPFGQPCSKRALGNGVALGHDFTTDVLEITFFNTPHELGEHVAFGYSLAYSLVQGAATVLEVPSNDLNASVVRDHDGETTIVLYDDVPGGAGLVAALEDPSLFRKVLVSAHQRVAGQCGCDESTSCYACLRSYGNQFVHPELARGPVKHFLAHTLERW